MRVKNVTGGKGMFSEDDFIKSFYFEAGFMNLYPLDSLEYLAFNEAIKIFLNRDGSIRYMGLLARMPETYGCESELDCIFSSLLLFFLRQTKKTVVRRIFGDYMLIPPTKLNFIQYTAKYIESIMCQYEHLFNEKIASTYEDNHKNQSYTQIHK